MWVKVQFNISIYLLSDFVGKWWNCRLPAGFTFSNNVFELLSTLGWRVAGLFNPFPHNDTFWRLRETSLLKTLWEKEKLLVTNNFSFSHSVFYLWTIFFHFRQIWSCRLQTLSLWKSLKSVVWERVNIRIRIFYGNHEVSWADIC